MGAALSNKRRAAFVLMSDGRRSDYLKMMLSLEAELAEHVPGVDVVRFDYDEARSMIPGFSGEESYYFPRLALPLMKQARGYDRLIWMDVDIYVRDDRFSRVLDVNTSADGLAMCRDIDVQHMCALLKRRYPCFSKTVYYNAGLVVMDLHKMRHDVWMSKVKMGLERHRTVHIPWADQGLLNAYFDINEMDPRFNAIWHASVDDPYAIHYAGPDGKKRLMDILGAQERLRSQVCDNKISASFIRRVMI